MKSYFISTYRSMKQFRALTLVEMLIALAVFAVGVLAILQMVVHNIGIVNRVAQHMDATMLASQGLELMYEVRNNNLYKELNWSCIDVDASAASGCNQTLTGALAAGMVIQIEGKGPLGSPTPVVKAVSLGSNPLDVFRLYAHSDKVNSTMITWFSHDDSGQETPYARYVSLAPLVDTNNTAYPTDTIIEITSHVLVSQ
jgi:prepilin-type N-terminal cleavage/methylation domain-containing protein